MRGIIYGLIMLAWLIQNGILVWLLMFYENDPTPGEKLLEALITAILSVGWLIMQLAAAEYIVKYDTELKEKDEKIEELGYGG